MSRPAPDAPSAQTNTADQLESLITTVNLSGLADWLLAADPSQLTEARSWYRHGRTWAQQQYAWDGEIARWRRNVRNDGELDWIHATLAVGLAGPRDAAKWVPWHQFWDHMDTALRAPFDRVLYARGRDWVADFVANADQITFSSSQLRYNAGAFFTTVEPAVRRFELPCPTGLAFGYGWRGHRSIGNYLSGGRYVVTSDRDRLESDPLLPELFHRCLEHGLLANWSDAVDTTIWLIDKGIVDRQRLLDQLWTMLTNRPAPATQRVLAGLITGLEVDDSEIPGGLPYLQNALATTHGSVGKALLPFAIRALATTADVEELAVTLAGRTEKAQRQTLAEALGSPAVLDRVGAAAAVAGLRVLIEAAEGDVRTQARLTAQLDRLDDRSERDDKTHTTEPVRGLWNRQPEGKRFESARLGEWPRLTDELAALVPSLYDGHGNGWGGSPASLADFVLAAFVREAWASSPDTVQAKVSKLTGPRGVSLAEAIRDHYRDPGADSYFAAYEQTGNVENPRDPDRTFSLAFPISSFRYLLARESLLRLGRVPCLLSTPSHADSSISFDAFVPRIELGHGHGFGPLDLLQALLRLRPVDASELHRLDGLSLPLDSAVNAPAHPCQVTDGVDAIRAWVLASGLPPLRPKVVDGNWAAGLEFPIPLDQFGLVPPGFLDGSGHQPHDALRIVPGWPDIGHLGLPTRESTGGLWHGLRMTATSTPRGGTTRIGYDSILQVMASSDDRITDRRVTPLLDLIVNDAFDRDLFRQAALDRLDRNVLGLARLLPVWDLIVDGGGLRQLWPVGIALADLGCRMKPKPANLAHLLLWLERLLPEVPQPGLPSGVRQLATERGDSKSHHQARALVAAFDRRSA